MKRRPITGMLNTVGDSSAQLKDDTTALHWGLCVLNSADPLDYVHEPIPYGKTIKVESFTPVAEARQIIVIGGATIEVVAASTRYKLEIHNPEDKYESHEQPPIAHAHTTAAALTGTAATDRFNLYTALVAKVNSYAGNNVTGLLMFQKAYTGGGTTGNETPIVGETALETTSAATARIISWTITSGTFAGGDAAGVVWMVHLTGTLSAVTKTWTYGSSSSTLSGTDAAVLGQGMALEDDAGYFISKLGRPGISWADLTQGFATATATVGLAGAYALGIGTVMLSLKPAYDHSKQEIVNHGDLEYEFTRGDLAVAGKTYGKIVITIRGGDEDAIDGRNVALDHQISVYVDYATSAYYDTLLAAILVAAAK